MVAENGRLIPVRLYTVNQHDILTGAQPDGTAFGAEQDMTCGNWTKSGEGNAMLGHADRMGLRDDDASKSWNSSHPSRACDAASLVATGGAGLLFTASPRTDLGAFLMRWNLGSIASETALSSAS